MIGTTQFHEAVRRYQKTMEHTFGTTKINKQKILFASLSYLGLLIIRITRARSVSISIPEGAIKYLKYVSDVWNSVHYSGDYF